MKNQLNIKKQEVLGKGKSLKNKTNFKKSKLNDKNNKKKQDGIKYIKSNKIKKEVDDDTMQLRRLYNRLMLKKETNKENIVKKIMSIIKNNFVTYAYKHDGCRILQGCVKYGNKEQRKEIITSLKENLYDLAIKKYAIYLAIKIWKYAEKEEQDLILTYIISKLKLLSKNNTGQTFINYIYGNSNNKMQEKLVKTYMMKVLKIDIEVVKIQYNKLLLEEVNNKDEESYNNNEDTEQEKSKFNDEESDIEMNSDDYKKTSHELNNNGEDKNNIIIKRSQSCFNEKFKKELKSTFELVLEKKTHTNYIFQASLSLLLDYLTKDVKLYLSELFDDDFEYFLNSKPGVELFSKLYIVASTKTKKKILKKLFKDNWFDSFFSNEYNIALLSKILLSTDDTKLSCKLLLKPCIVFSSNSDFRILAKVLNNILIYDNISFNNFNSKLIMYNKDTSSKKDVVKIQEELVLFANDDIKSIFNVNFECFLIEPELIEYINNMFKFLVSNDNQLQDLLIELLKILYEYIIYDINNNKEKVCLSKEGHFTIVSLLKKVICCDNKNFKCIIDDIEKLIISNLELFLNSKGVFIVLLVSESQYYGDLLRKKIKESKQLLTSILKESPSSKAVAILLKKFCCL